MNGYNYRIRYSQNCSGRDSHVSDLKIDGYQYADPEWASEFSERQLRSWTEAAEEVVHQAGKLLLDYYADPVRNQRFAKADSSPVTEADLAVEKYLTETLPQVLDVPVVGEEGMAAGKSLSSETKNYWLVDPLDGTQNFINRDDEFSILVALISQGKPVIGIIYPAAKRVSYSSFYGGGASKLSGQERWSISHPGLAKDTNLSQLKVMASKLPTEAAKGRTREFLELNQIPESQLYRVGSGYKHGLMAEGQCDVIVCFDRMYEWDIAAADCLLREAGCFTVDIATNLPQKYHAAADRKFSGYLAACNGLEFVLS